MNRLIICENLADPKTWFTTETNDVCAHLVDHFNGSWPKTARIYHDQVAQSNDVTPFDKASVERLTQLSGDFYVVVYPAAFATILFIISIAISAVELLLSFILRPKADSKNQRIGSPNNSLSNRQNRERPNERIPDIYGSLWATPDLIMVPYRVFISNKEVEYMYMCLGRGKYDVAIVRDDTTPVDQIDGVGVEVYAPFTSPLSGDEPQLRVGPLTLANPHIADIPGTGYSLQNPRYHESVYLGYEFVEQYGVYDIYRPYTADLSRKGNLANWKSSNSSSNFTGLPGGYTPSDPRMYTGDLPLPDSSGGTKAVKNVKRSNAINGQTLIAPNANKWKPSQNVVFISTDVIATTGDVDWTNLYTAGELLTIGNATVKDSAGAQPDTNLDGTYIISAVNPNSLVLQTPWLVNANWTNLAGYGGGETLPCSPTLVSDFSGWVGPFILDEPYMKEVWVNFVAQSGLYEVDSKGNQIFLTCDVEIGVQAIDASGAPVGDEHYFTAKVVGNSNTRTTCGTTLRAILPIEGPCQIRARRRSNTDLRDGFSVVDQVQWRDVYCISDVDVTDWGNVTTVLAVTWPTQDALAVKERKINMLIGRRIPRVYAKWSHRGPWIHQAETPAYWNQSQRKMTWIKATPSTSTSTIGVISDSWYTEVSLNSIPTGNSGGADGVLASDGGNFWLGQGSGYDTWRIMKFPYSGGAPLVILGSIGFGGIYPIAHRVRHFKFGGTNYVYAQRDAGMRRFNIDSMLDADVKTCGFVGSGGSRAICVDSSGKSWVSTSNGLSVIDWSGTPSSTDMGHSSLADARQIEYCATDNSIIVQTAGNIYKYDIATDTILYTRTTPSGNAHSISNVGVDNNFVCDGYKISAIDLSTVQSAPSFYASWTGTGTFSGVFYNMRLFDFYDSLRNMNFVINNADQIYALYMGPALQALYEAETTANLAEIIVEMSKDPYIGNRPDDQIDIEGIFASAGYGQEISTYFGTDRCVEFCFTFDDSNVSFEEMVTTAAQAGFSTMYRRGNVLSLFFEKETNISTIMFNHRNKLPQSEKRSVTFGSASDNDGLEVDYIDPNAPNSPNIDTTVTLYYPPDKSATNARKVRLVGVRNNVQAWLLGWRMYQKLLYQNTNVEFRATKIAAVSIAQERILVADNTRQSTQDGEILGVSGLQLHTSQKVVFQGGHTYTIFLQHPDKTVEGIAITLVDDQHVLLGTAPSQPLVTDPNSYARTTYQIVDDASPRSDAFLLQEKNPEEGMVYEVKATNYDSRYYDHDQDFIDNVVVENSHAGAYNSGYSPQDPDNIPPDPVVSTDTTDPNKDYYIITVDGN